MFGLSQLYERLILLGVIAVMAVSGFFYIEHLGAKGCEHKQQDAAIADAARIHKIDQDTIDDLNKQLNSLASPAAPSGQPAPHIGVCKPSGVLSARSPAAGSQPGAGAVADSDRGVPGGMAVTIDAGPSMQDFALASLFYLSDSQELYGRAVKEADAHR